MIEVSSLKCNNKINMNDYIGLGILVIFLIISLLIAKKDFKNWYELEAKDKMYTLRAIILISFGIMFLLWKIMKP